MSEPRIHFITDINGAVQLHEIDAPEHAYIRYEINYPRKKLFFTAGKYLAPIQAPRGAVISARLFIDKKGLGDTFQHTIEGDGYGSELKASTEIACTQNRDFLVYDWAIRHQNILRYNQETKPNLLLIGDSILHFWAGQPQDDPALPQGNVAPDLWERLFRSYRPSNLGYGYDRIENVLWRVKNGELDHSTDHARILLAIGTNNLSENTDEEIIAGMKNLLSTIKRIKPQSPITVLGIYPRDRDAGGTTWPRLLTLNPAIGALAQELQCDFLSYGECFLRADGKINTTLIADGVHPTYKGYELIVEKLSSVFQ